MVEILVTPEGPNYYAYLTGRWYVSPSNWLWLEVTWDTGPFWPFKANFYGFVREDELREIYGDFCA